MIMTKEQDALATSSAVPRAELADEPRLVTAVLRCSVAEAGLVTTRCPQCGINPSGEPKEHQWRFVPPWVYMMFGMGMWWVALFAYFVVRRKVITSLMLCADCAKTAARSRWLRSLSVVGMAALPTMFGLVGAALHEVGFAIGAMTGVVSGIVGMVAAHRHTRFDLMHCKHIDKTNDTMTLQLSPAAVKVFREETIAVVVNPQPPPPSLLSNLFRQSPID
jgi:hypothetical protein